MREATYSIGDVVIGTAPYLITEPPKGISDGPPVRAATTPRPHQHGAYGDRGYANARQVVLAGKALGASSWAALEAYRDALLASCLVYEPTDMRITSAAIDRLVRVRSAGTGLEWVEDNVYTTADWQLSWELLDPRQYSWIEHTASTTLPSTGGTGVGFPMAAPISFGGGSAGGQMLVANAGTAPAPWVATFTGPLVQPALQWVEGGRTLTFNASLASGETLVVDSDAHSVLLDGTANRYSWLVSPQWWDLPALATSTIRLLGASGAGNVVLTWRDAWW